MQWYLSIHPEDIRKPKNRTIFSKHSILDFPMSLGEQRENSDMKRVKTCQYFVMKTSINVFSLWWAKQLDSIWTVNVHQTD